MGKPRKSQTRSQRKFIDGFDSYAEEYLSWRRFPGVRRLIGVFDLPPSEFEGKSCEELLAATGQCHFTIQYYTAEIERIESSKDFIAGGAMAVQDQAGAVRPIIVLRNEVGPERDTSIGAQSFRLAILLHEIGHADDITKGINFNHRLATVDPIGTEVYAHRFVYDKCIHHNYQLALMNYFQVLRNNLQSEILPTRVSAERMLAEIGEAEADKWNRKMLYEDSSAFERNLRLAGRLDEYRRWRQAEGD